ncbi:MAG: AmmeMemoRadiSam system radical SAM enzyme [Azovibrio sp.]|uniref:AmmeMemoRadiSam system radical SAM enzyme n=1 Tax=Azovibrio sp. TaxID=1872673 RepID=UPI003C7324FF
MNTPARWWHPLPDGHIQCDLCPRNCRLHEGQRGACYTRRIQGGQMVLTVYGRSSGFCLDPIEKKPLNHFYPGSSVLSFGTAGCNLACKFCQNWEISHAKAQEEELLPASPDAIADAALAWQARSVAYTYNDPVISAEYVLDTARACREAGILNVAVTAGYIRPEPAREFFTAMDAANVDLKSFSDNFYYKLCAGHLQPVLDILEYIHKETDCWLELTTLLIPGHNDDPAEIEALCAWVAEHLGPDVPLHFTAFHGAGRMQDVPGTPPATLTRAREQALAAGLHYVYTGNVHDPAGAVTACPGCGSELVARDWHRILRYRLTPAGACPQCGLKIPGRFAAHVDSHNIPPIPIRLS